MRKEIKSLIAVYLAIVLLKIILAYLIPSPTIFSDEYTYAKLARDFFQNGTLLLPGGITSQVTPLYSIILSVVHFFSMDMTTLYFLMKVLNAFMSATIIFPIYLLAKDFVTKKQSLFIALLVSLMAANLNMSSYIASENLYYPLFAFAIYFIYKAFKEQDTSLFFISGVFIALCYLSRVLGIVLVPIVFLVAIFYRTKIKNIFIHYLAAFFVVLPQLWSHVDRYGFSILGLLGGYKGPTFVTTNVSSNSASLVNWVILHMGYIALAVGIILGIYFLCGWFIRQKNFRLLYTIVLFVVLINILVVSNQTAKDKQLYDTPFNDIFNNRPIGRYADAVVSVVALIGFIALLKLPTNSLGLKLSTAATAIVLPISAQLAIAPLFPMNNQNLTAIGAIQAGLEKVFYGKIFLGTEFHWAPFIILASLFLVIPIMVYFLRGKRTVLLTLVTLFIVGTSVLSFGVTYWNSTTHWDTSDQATIGKWFDDYDQGESRVLMEFVDCEEAWISGNLDTLTCTYRGTLAAFWMNNDIDFGFVEASDGYDYYVSRDCIHDYPIVHQVGDLVVYKL